MTVEKLHELEIKQLHKDLDAIEFNTNDDVRTYITNMTKLIYDYKMYGLVLDYYAEDCEYHKQDKTVFNGLMDIIANIAELCAAFPNLRTHIESIIVYKVDDNFYKASRRLHYWGNNNGASKYGPPTYKSLLNKCMNMSIIYIKKIDGKWKITFEQNSDSQDWMREVMTSDAPACCAPAQVDALPPSDEYCCEEVFIEEPCCCE